MTKPIDDELYVQGKTRYTDLMRAMQSQYEQVGEQMCREATAYPLAQRELCEYYRSTYDDSALRYEPSALTLSTDFGDVTLHTAFDPEIQSVGIIYPQRGT